MTFHFGTNPYFPHSELVKSFGFEIDPITLDLQVTRSSETVIQWSGPELDPRRSPTFFQLFAPPPELAAAAGERDDAEGSGGGEGESESDHVAPSTMSLDTQYSVFEALREVVVPNAVRWFNGDIQQSVLAAVDTEVSEHSGPAESDGAAAPLPAEGSAADSFSLTMSAILAGMGGPSPGTGEVPFARTLQILSAIGLEDDDEDDAEGATEDEGGGQ